MYQRILVAMDDSDSARRGLEEAIRLARVGGGRLLLVHVYEEPLPLSVEGDWSVPTLPAEAWREAGQRLLDQSAAVCARAGVTAQTRLIDAGGRRVGPLVSAAAADWSADLIVVGTHGRRGLDRLLLGSVAEGILRTAHTPVLLLPPPTA
ncbi:MAG: universal stress protein [Thiobacillaceae bacterium]|nr:universal stress protein [Thiobacillaceae bacterium]MCX7672079.1 universal stress protein [Thiobacillaceae bacterium]MDW8324328.1 universal stress protein [Burkholderiales bacterium]